MLSNYWEVQACHEVLDITVIELQVGHVALYCLAMMEVQKAHEGLDV